MVAEVDCCFADEWIDFDLGWLTLEMQPEDSSSRTEKKKSQAEPSEGTGDVFGTQELVQGSSQNYRQQNSFQYTPTPPQWVAPFNFQARRNSNLHLMTRTEQEEWKIAAALLSDAAAEGHTERAKDGPHDEVRTVGPWRPDLRYPVATPPDQIKQESKDLMHPGRLVKRERRNTDGDYVPEKDFNEESSENDYDNDDDEDWVHRRRLRKTNRKRQRKVAATYRSVVAQEMPKHRRQDSAAIRSYEIFERYGLLGREVDGKIDASQILSKGCFTEWRATRKGYVQNPHESFRRALMSHVTGLDGRKPFHPEVEAAILKEVRRTKVWECFEGEFDNRGKAVQIGMYGFRGLGFWESQTGREN